MIAAIKGKVEKKEPNRVLVDVNGVVYEIFISLNSYSKLKDEVYLHTIYIIREDAHLLFGFIDEKEKQLFEKLLKINGVGPKVALSICSTFSPFEFANIISSNDIKSLKKVPGIGPKSAGRILVELNGFDAILLSDEDTTNSNSVVNEASMALESLGYKKDDISKALSLCSLKDDTSSLVKEALKVLSKV